MWVKDQKKALKWLKLINEFDPQFTKVTFQESPLTKKLCEYYSCEKSDLFNNLLFKEHKAKKEIIESSIDKALYTWKEYFVITRDMNNDKRSKEEKKSQ